MLDINTLFEFSRNNCAAICAFLVPANLLATSQTLLLLFLERPLNQVRFFASIGNIFALTMFFHILTWLIIGVVMAPTFILLGLGITCLVINFYAIIFPDKLQILLKFCWNLVREWLLKNPLVTGQFKS